MSENRIEAAPKDSVEVRTHLTDALRLDLVGPPAGHELSEELLPGWVRPSNWYLTGFLIPTLTPPEHRSDDDAEDDIDEIPERAGLSEESNDDRKAAKKSFFPSSMGLSFLVSKDTRLLNVTARWGEYSLDQVPGQDGKNITVWRRTPNEETISVELSSEKESATIPIPGSGGVELHILDRPITFEDFREDLPEGARSVSIFLVNHKEPNLENPDLSYVFQAELKVVSENTFLPRPDLRGAAAEEWDERVAELHYSDTLEYATGHGVSVDWECIEDGCKLIRTSWIPDAQVEKVSTISIPEVELSMDALSDLTDGAAVKQALAPLVRQYRDWIKTQSSKSAQLSVRQKETSDELVNNATFAASRIEKGIDLLSDDPQALDAFRVANRAVSRALKKRLKIDRPNWRAFQLAFILLNLPGIADPKEPNRETVDLLFFPTGGGKTEAYLGLAAFTMVLRRLRNPAQQALVGAGVSVIMRYTLRLLTLDQLARAAGLVCALELEREENPEQYGNWPFEIGLWVGKAATPNVLGRKGESRPDSARTKVRQFKNDQKNKPSPIPLENCPWCGEKFEADSFALLPNDDQPKELRIVCTNFECEFTRDRALPIVAVDEQIYRRLPSFLIATVDKFASLPWVGESGVILGGADRSDSNGFYGASQPGIGTRLESKLLPPDLIIQDELHLIAGPLGTIAGLHETSIEALTVREIDGKSVRPKIVASTATARRAQDQIQALFARPITQIFPPPGPNKRDSFFAETKLASEVPARMYLGIAAQGRNPKVIMRRVYLALMGAAEKVFRDHGGHKNPDNPADPYMTVLGYFNSLRELGGARRILEEEVQNTVKKYGARKRIGVQRGSFQDRRTFSEVLELTSRVSTDKVAEARQRLECSFHEKGRVDCAIATNMISVGLDIQRLGLMVVLGQPKSHAEYIQATSRVGRDDKRPGLVVTVLNMHKPRDRSHYERFRYYHETFYRSVEGGSVTPFSARALDRGFSGALVSLARHINPVLSPARGVGEIRKVRAELEKLLIDVFCGRVRQQPFASEDEREERLRSVQNRVVDLLDSWQKIIDGCEQNGVAVRYQRYEANAGHPLLREMLETNFDSIDEQKFRANRSMRDVEPEVNLYIRDLSGRTVEDAE